MGASSKTASRPNASVPDHALQLMARAREIARDRLGGVSPRPAVGAVVARESTVLGAAGTEAGNGRHAERAALDLAGDDARGADLYVTLEPCAHHGSTPPCADAIVEAGISRVYIGTRDPNPASGDGVASLEQSGVEVHEDVSSNEGSAINQGFFKWIATGRPYVTAKWAMSLDGKIATRSGDSKYISGSESRQITHRLRKETDAICVGIDTVIVDDPLLTCRLPVDDEFQPLRVVLDSAARMPPAATMLAEPSGAGVLVVASATAPDGSVEALRDSGAEVMLVPDSGPRDIGAVLDALGRRGILNLLVEGGGAVLGSFFDLRLVDRVEAFIAPIVLGGLEAPGPVGGVGSEMLADAFLLTDSATSISGDDIRFSGVLREYGPLAG